MEQSNPVKPGDSNRITREYLDSLLLEMRLVDSDLPSTELTLFGQRFASPVMTAALSHLTQQRPDGMAEFARGAAAANMALWVGIGDAEELEGIAATGARFVKIIKPYRDEKLIFDKISHAERLGAPAVGMDIDHSFKGGGYDQIQGHEMRPKSIAQLKEYVAATKLPFVVKGVLSERDAEKALEAGAGGIVVSHHHGIMDYAVPPLMILPRIAKVIGGRIPVIVDCGIESGADVFKALALGADAVSVGRALIPPLKEGGAAAVKEKMEAITRELAHIMAMTGSPDVRHIDPGVIVRSR